MSDHEPPELADQLSAYLDGELDAAGTRAVEERLATDETARAELARLERAWRMLDGLPRSAANPDFTATTVEMIALDTARGADTDTAHSPARQWGLIAATVAVALLGGYWLVAAFVPNTNQQLIADLPVIENLDAYRQAHDLKFVRSLIAAHLFEADEHSTSVAPNHGNESPDQRAARVDAMSAEQKESLREHYDRFVAMSESEQDQLRQLSAELAAEPDAGTLWATVTRYHNWLDRLSAVQRAELAQLDTVGRIERIQQLKTADPKRKNRPLSRDDQRAIAAWIEQRAVAAMPAATREEFANMNESERRRAVGRVVWQRWLTGEPGKGALALSEEDLTDLLSKLSPEAQEQLSHLHPPQRRMTLLDWVRQSMMPAGERREGEFGNSVSRQRLQDFLDHELSPAEREQLMTLPADEMQSRLKRLYFQHMMSPGGMRGPDGKGRGMGPGPRPPSEPRQPRGDAAP